MSRHAAPTSKVTAAGAAGAAVIVLMYLARLLGLDLPEDVAVAAVLLATFGAGYLKRENRPAGGPGGS